MKGYLARTLGGWRQVRLRGHRPERLVEQCLAEGFEMWQLERDHGDLMALVTERGYQALVRLAPDLGIDIASIRQGGLPMRWHEIRRRPFLLVGLLTWWAIVSYATSRVWVVNVDVPNVSVVEAQALLTAARLAGLAVGVPRHLLNIPQIRRRMLSELPQFSWIGIHTRGMVAMIEAVPLVVRPPNHLPSRLVASKSGRVTAVEVYMGAAEVAPGENVKAGQTLIQGVVTAKLPDRDTDEGAEREESVVTPAEGRVLADVTYRVTAFQALKSEERKLTGRTFVQRFLLLNDRTIWPIPTLSSNPFRSYVEEKFQEPIHWAGVDLPIEMISVVYNEVVTKSVHLTPVQARSLARERALNEIRRMVPGDATRVRESQTVKTERTGVRVTIEWVMNENIAKPPQGQ
ncbi:MAG: sporulation protein YqfD [Firmicutes bacterium]|nr:sporulation protein YqfD [Bacillota bacterium]